MKENDGDIHLFLLCAFPIYEVLWVSDASMSREIKGRWKENVEISTGFKWKGNEGKKNEESIPFFVCVLPIYEVLWAYNNLTNREIKGQRKENGRGTYMFESE